MTAAWVIVILLIVALVFLFSAVKIAREYERGVVFRLGRLIGIKGPGLFILIPFVDKAVKVDLRTITLNVPPQEVITKDNVTVKVNAVAYFRVVDASKAIVQVENYLVATSQIAQTTLRSVLGQVDLDQLLSERDQINDRLQTIIDEQTHPWGVKVSVVEVKDVELPQTMQRAIARQAEAERERRAKIIAADGEYQASEHQAGDEDEELHGMRPTRSRPPRLPRPAAGCDRPRRGRGQGVPALRAGARAPARVRGAPRRRSASA
jgi:regulator of protease activity HflC (stomatin/prohibitin superfamily)